MDNATGECMEVKVQDETFVFDVQIENVYMAIAQGSRYHGRRGKVEPVKSS